MRSWGRGPARGFSPIVPYCSLSQALVFGTSSWSACREPRRVEEAGAVVGPSCVWAQVAFFSGPPTLENGAVLAPYCIEGGLHLPMRTSLAGSPWRSRMAPMSIVALLGTAWSRVRGVVGSAMGLGPTFIRLMTTGCLQCSSLCLSVVLVQLLDPDVHRQDHGVAVRKHSVDHSPLARS